MSDYTRKPPGHECPPYPEDPAPQPHPPGGDCAKLPTCDPPVLKLPEKCPDPDPHCKCPKPPGNGGPNCLEDLIAKQTADIVAAGNADKLKKELETLLDTAKKAAAKYTRDRYVQLVEEWIRQDTAIAELVRKLVCSVKCWRCILDCYVCPLLNDLHYAEKWLYDDGKHSTEVYDLYDLQHWYTQDRAAKLRLFNRVDGILKAWQDPFGTIEKILAANKTLTEAASKVIGNEPGKAIYDVFLKLIPLHLAIAPPAGPDTKTRIDRKFTKFCECDQGEPVECCGIDVGEWSLRQRLIGPQPFLIDPADYFKLICCLVEKRYLPAKDALTKTETELASIASRIARYEKQLTDGLNPDNFATAAKAAIPSVIDCCDYEPDNGHDDHHDDTPPRSYRR